MSVSEFIAIYVKAEKKRYLDNIFAYFSCKDRSVDIDLNYHYIRLDVHVVNQSNLIQRSSKSLALTLKFLYSAKTEAQSQCCPHHCKKVEKQIKLNQEDDKRRIVEIISYREDGWRLYLYIILYVVFAKMPLRCVICVNECKNKNES